MTRLFAVLRGLVYGSGFVLLWGWIAASALPLDPRLAVSLPEWLRVPGFVLAGCGAALDLWCLLVFALAGKGTPAPFDPPREFVAVGPYRYARNPMFLGGFWVLAGAGLGLGSPAVLGVAGLFFLLAHAFVVLYEEPSLERRFGPSYREYKSSVNRWWPRRPP
jgi:protein-S-isoprenylcysteine O-methyltransferase Ste14